MADRRIKDLTTVATPTTTHKLAIDKTGMAEAGAITVASLADLIGGVKRGTLALTADTEATVTFSTAFADTDYIIIPYCFDSNGDSVGFNINTRTTASFKITAAANCSLEYIAIAL